MDQWGLVTQITTPDVGATADFGHAVSIDGDRILVGAYRDSSTQPGAGSAFVYYKDQGGPDQWGQAAELVPSGLAPGDYFGWDVHLSGEYAAVSARDDTDQGAGAGSVYLFRQDEDGPDQWGQWKKIFGSGTDSADDFGDSIALQGTTLVVGSPNDEVLDTDGVVYVFRRDEDGPHEWGEVAIFTAADPIGPSSFGSPVDLDGDTVVVGARNDSFLGLNAGSAYAFQRDFGGWRNWGQIAKVMAGDGEADDLHGGAIAISGETFLVGAENDDHDVAQAGAAYLYGSTGVSLTIPDPEPTLPGIVGTTSVVLDTRGLELATVKFSIDFDETCLSIDPTDADFDDIPDAVELNLSDDFTSIVYLDPGDSDGELDIRLFSESSNVTFSDGLLATLAFQVSPACSPSAGQMLPAPVRFSHDVSPTFFDWTPLQISGFSSGAVFEIQPAQAGDCDADTVISAEDLSALQLETFDGDGDFWLDVPGGDFPGYPVGCDANEDTQVDAGDFSCVSLLLASQTCNLQAAMETPVLSTADQLPVSDGVATAQFHLETDGASLNSLTFSIDFDESAVEFVDEPGAVRFFGPNVEIETYEFDPDDSDGELDFVLSDSDIPSLTFLDGLLIEVDLQAITPGPTLQNPVAFSSAPGASFGDTAGRSVDGIVRVGGPEIFSDGFESGDRSAWSSATGGSL